MSVCIEFFHVIFVFGINNIFDFRQDTEVNETRMLNVNYCLIDFILYVYNSLHA